MTTETTTLRYKKKFIICDVIIIKITTTKNQIYVVVQTLKT